MDNYILSDDVSRYTVFTNDTELLRQNIDHLDKERVMLLEKIKDLRDVYDKLQNKYDRKMKMYDHLTNIHLDIVHASLGEEYYSECPDIFTFHNETGEKIKRVICNRNNCIFRKKNRLK